MFSEQELIEKPAIELFKFLGVTHQDIGQMDFYVRYFEKEVKQPEDNPTIGLILCAQKNEAMANYTILENNKTVFASKYKLYLPTEKELMRE